MDCKFPAHVLRKAVCARLTSGTENLTAVCVHGRVVFGNSSGLAVVDYLQKTLLLNMGTSELYSPSDPYQRQPRSPRKARQPPGGELLSITCQQHLTAPCQLLHQCEMYFLSHFVGEIIPNTTLSRYGCVEVGEGGGSPHLAAAAVTFAPRAPPPCSSSRPSTGGTTDRLSICSVGRIKDGGACELTVCVVGLITVFLLNCRTTRCSAEFCCFLIVIPFYHSVIHVLSVWCWI